MSPTPTVQSHTAAALRAKLAARTAEVGVVGLGYVGLPLAVEFARAGFRTTGIDLDHQKVDAINRGESYIQDVTSQDVAGLQAANRLVATTDPSTVSGLDTVNICVPTPLRKTKDPDLSYVVSAVEMIADHLHPGMLVILESTTYPGHDRGGRAAHPRTPRAESRRGLLPGVFARARGPRQRAVAHAQRAEGRGRPDARLLGARRPPLLRLASRRWCR